MSCRSARAARRAVAAVAVFALAISAPAQRPSPGGDPLQTIARWTSEYRRLGPNLDPDSDAGLLPALATLKRRFLAVEAGENDALVAVCDVASIAAAGNDAAIAAGRYVPGERESRVREAARGVLRSAFDVSAGEGRGYWLATNVLGRGADQPLPRRIAVAEALIGRHWDSTLLALFTASEAPERGLREAAVTALCGWRSDVVDRYLAKLTVRALRESDFLSTDALLGHFATRQLPLDHPAAVEVANGLAQAAVSSDWRLAVRRIPLMRALPDELAVPPLIEALALWHDRGVGGLSSRRVEAVIVQELELRSKRHLGMSAERWATWWKSMHAKTVDAAAAKESGGELEGVTEAAFFGLRPCTDRVVFVLDRSGSMAEPFGTDRNSSRYTEALRQLGVILVQLGPRTHFNVVLFSDDPHAWSTALKPATPAMIDSALKWARNSPPQGGTMLRPAVLRTLEVDPRTGRPDLEKLEADTVIVLCDGATSEGAAWVAPFLRSVKEETCVRFDCVQIGNTGNGTLESLAKESGGQFVQVD